MIAVGGNPISLAIVMPTTEKPVLIGTAGIFAFPMSARAVNRVGLEVSSNNSLLMHAMESNTAGLIASVMAGGAILALLAR
jgi:Na+-transporting methylmalonyl-CoA/oxaloacetate decarboxylase beta subunit